MGEATDRAAWGRPKGPGPRPWAAGRVKADGGHLGHTHMRQCGVCTPRVRCSVSSHQGRCEGTKEALCSALCSVFDFWL